MCTVQYRQTDRTQLCVMFNTYTQTADSNVYCLVPTAHRTQQCVQFSTDTSTTDSNVYNSVPTDPLQTTMCTVQYRQTDVKHQYNTSQSLSLLYN